MRFYIIGLCIALSTSCYAQEEVDVREDPQPSAGHDATGDGDIDKETNGDVIPQDLIEAAQAGGFESEGQDPSELPHEFMGITEKQADASFKDSPVETKLSDPGANILGILKEKQKREKEKQKEKEKKKEESGQNF